MNRDEAQAIADAAGQVLREADLEPVLTTLDASEAPAAAQQGYGVVVVSPPRLTFVTHHQADAAWDITLVAGPTADAGWARLDAMLSALRLPLDLDAAEPTALAGTTGTAYPAYRCTRSDTYTL